METLPSSPRTTVPRGTLDLTRHLNYTQIPARFRAPRTTHGKAVQHERHPEGPYRDEGVLLSLQLLAYLSKYPTSASISTKPDPLRLSCWWTRLSPP